MVIFDRARLRGRVRRASVSVLVLPTAGLCAGVGALAAQRPATPSASAAPARRAVDVRWYPWIGCWQRTTDVTPAAGLTCVVPAEGASAVDVLAIANGSIESRERIVVDARPHPIDRDGCTGSQTATWATSGARVYLGAAYTCGAALHGRSSTLYAILPSGDWLETRDVRSGGGRVLTVTRYRDAGLPATVPTAVRSEIAHHALAAATARASAGASVSANDVAEAERAVDTAVVQAWLTARAQGYATAATATAAGTAPQAAPAVTQVRVYEGTPPRPPALEPMPSSRVPVCDASGCYVENQYSDFNGFSYVPYSPYPTMYPGAYYVPYVTPIVVIRGGSRFDGHRPVGGRPPVIHVPFGHQQTGPSGIRPVQPAPGGRIAPRGRP
jgi:hypothetical protein